MARFTDIDKLDNEPAEKKSGVRFTDIDALDDTPKQAEKPSLYQRAKSLFTSDKSKAMTVQQGEVSPQPVQAQTAPKQMTTGRPQSGDYADTAMPGDQTSAATTRQMTVEPEGPLSRAASFISDFAKDTFSGKGSVTEKVFNPEIKRLPETPEREKRKNELLSQGYDEQQISSIITNEVTGDVKRNTGMINDLHKQIQSVGPVIKKETELLTNYKTDLTAAQDKLAKLKDQIKQTKDKAEVDKLIPQFNAQISDFNAKVKRYNAQLGKIKPIAEEHDRKVGEINDLIAKVKSVPEFNAPYYVPDENPDDAIGLLDAIASVATSWTTGPILGALTLAGSVINEIPDFLAGKKTEKMSGKEIGEEFEKVAKQHTWEPKTEFGREVTNLAAAPFEGWYKMGDLAMFDPVDHTLTDLGKKHPEAAAAIGTATTIVPYAVMMGRSIKSVSLSAARDILKNIPPSELTMRLSTITEGRGPHEVFISPQEFKDFYTGLTSDLPDYVKTALIDAKNKGGKEFVREGNKKGVTINISKGIPKEELLEDKPWMAKTKEAVGLEPSRKILRTEIKEPEKTPAKPQFTDDLPAETHAELIKQEEIKPADVEEKGFVLSDDKLIPAIKTAEGEIVDAEGKKGGDFLSRTQAKNHLKENNPDVHNALAAKLGDDYELHSQDLKKAESLVKAESIAKSIDEIAPEQPKAPEIEAIDKGIKPVDEAKSEVQANLLPVDIKPTTITPDVSAEAKEDIPDKSQEEAKPILPAKKAKSDVYKVSPEVKEVPVDQITLSRDVPQFKSNASDKGIVEPLSGAYDRLPTNPIVLWQRENGALEIITGRHRYDLAQRTGEKTIPAQIVKEADGFTTQDALTFDAEQNIKDNQGSDFDYANYFRNTNITEEEAKSRGVLRGEKANTAFLLGKSATDSTFNAYRSGQIKFKQAAAIAKAAPGDEALQNEGLRYLLNEGSKSNDLETENYIKAISQFEAVKPADQGDLFGYDDSAIRSAAEMSKKVSKIQNALRKDAANINAAILKSEALQLTPEAMQKYDITDGKDKTQLKAAHQKILADLDKWDKWATNPELVAQLKGEPKGMSVEEEKPSYGAKKRKWSDVEGLTDAQKEARKRIEKDVKLLSANAEEAGQTLPEYLKAIGLDDAKAKRLLDYANSQPVEPPKTTGVKNAVVDEERAKRGLPPLEKDMTKANKVTLNNAKDAVDSGRIKPRLIAQNMVENPRNFFDEEEEAALFYDRAKLQNEYANAAELREAAEKSGNPKDIYDAEIKLAALELDLANNDKAATIGGTVSARTLQFRTRLIAEDYSLAAMTTQFKKAHGWKEISERQRKEIISLYKETEDTKKAFEEEQKKAEKRELADAFDRMKKDKTVRKAVEQKSKSIEEIKAASEARYAKLADQLKKHLASLHMNIDPTGVKIMAMMAKEKFIGGLKDINKIVDDIHETLSAAEPDLTKRDIRDAITKYGKEPKRQTTLQKEYNDALRQGQLLSAYEDALKGEIPSLKKNTKSPRNEKTVELEKKVKEAMRQAGIDFTNQANSEETYLKRAKTYYDNRTKEIKRKIEEEDLAPPLKKAYPIDEELMQKKAAYEGVKKEFRKMVLAEKLRNQPLDEKILRKIVAANRAIIFTSLSIFEKLTFAGAARFAFEPLKSLIGGTFSYVPGIHYFAERAPIEGGGIIANAKGDIKRFSQIIAKQSYRDMWDMLTTGENTLSKLDPKNDMYPKGDKIDKILAYPAQTHEAFKTVPKRGGYYYAYEKYVQHCLTNGIDPLNPVVADTIHIAALDYAKRQIFRNQNPVTKLWHETMGSIERKLPRAGKYITAEAQVDMPVVGVPTNIGIELYEMATGWMTAPAQMAYYRTFGREAVKNLKPEQFDNIYRAFKNGMVGVAIALIGWYLYEKREDEPVKLGGFYVKGEKRKSTDIKADEAKVYDMNVSKNMLHNTYLMFLQGGYTAAKVSDEYRKAMKGSELEALWTGAGATAKGIASTVPFFETPYKMGSAIVNPKRGEKFIAEKVKRVIPPTVQKWAKDHDVDESGEPIPRSPEGVIENILMGIPGLREDVPIDTKKQKEDLKSVLTDDLRNKEPGARKNLNQALRQGKITEIEYDDIDKKASEKGSAIAINAKNMKLEELAKRLRENATPEQRKLLLPILKKKFFGQAGNNLDKDQKREYRDLIKKIKDE